VVELCCEVTIGYSPTCAPFAAPAGSSASSPAAAHPASAGSAQVSGLPLAGAASSAMPSADSSSPTMAT
jgi:hypothetical protein